jgi:hypothetical protein
VDTPTSRAAYVLAIAGVSVVAALAILRAAHARPSRRAALLGLAAGLWFGLSATFTKETIEQLHHGVGYTLSHPEVYGLLGFGAIAFVVQQLSLATGQLAPAMAAVSVANPIISVLLGILLFDERLTRPWWHVIVASLALLAALYGAVLITMSNRDLAMPGRPGQDQNSPASPLASR